MQLDPEVVLVQVDHFEAEARSRGVTHTTFRHITDALNLSGNQCHDLRELRINSRPWQIHRLPDAPELTEP
ncbi:hypothetical protein [Streptomyces olivochromogenes]|uniref:hypothetical protein n=1 Tax=Streptomyces olivochromogenes TaxID=1963 RepID=UPI0027E3B8D5|nr:hypothetical protein [Streptomyces olivochromogenes]